MGMFPGVMSFLWVRSIGLLASSSVLNVPAASIHTCGANVPHSCGNNVFFFFFFFTVKVNSFCWDGVTLARIRVKVCIGGGGDGPDVGRSL